MAAAEQMCVVGAGAIGSTVAAQLTASGRRVSLVARGRRLEQLREQGLAVCDEADAPRHYRLPVSENPEFGVQDVVFLAVKAQALPQVLPAILPMIGSDTLVVPLVNGIPWWYFQDHGGVREGAAVSAVDRNGTLVGLLPAAQIVGCVVYIKAHMREDGTVEASREKRLQLGTIATSPKSGLEALVAMLVAAGIDATPSLRIRDEVWVKVALNLATNPLSVVSEANLHDQFHHQALLPIVARILHETAAVAAAYGADRSMDVAAMVEVGRRAGAFETSMLQDFRRGLPLELAAIGGAVLELAGMVDLDMPTARLMVDLAGYRGQIRLNS